MLVEDPHTLTPAKVLKAYGVDPETGLSTTQVESQRKVHGQNGESESLDADVLL